MPTGGKTMSNVSSASLLKPLGERRKAVRRQNCMVILANLGIVVLGVVGAFPAVTLNELTDPKTPPHLNESEATWFASINFVASPIGALSNAFILDRIGRKWTFVVMNVLGIIGWLLLITALYEDSTLIFIQLLISRFVSGIALGLTGAPVGVYGAEISYPKYRGRLILGSIFARASGTTFIYILGYFIRDDYHFIALIITCLQTVCLILLIPIVESPCWLLLKGRDVEAKKALKYFRGLEEDDVNQELEDEFEKLKKAANRGKDEPKLSLWKALLLPEVYKPLLIMMGLFMAQQCTGNIIFIVYAVHIIIGAGVKMDPFLCAIILGVAKCIVTLMMMWLLELWGRRRAMMISLTGMAIGMFALAAPNWVDFLDFPFYRVGCILIYMVANAMGIQLLPFFMLAEVFPQKYRGPLAGITTSFGFLIMFVTVKTYLVIERHVGSAMIFLFFGFMSVLTIVFAYIFLPETRGKTLAEIEKYFRGSRGSV